MTDKELAKRLRLLFPRPARQLTYTKVNWEATVDILVDKLVNSHHFYADEKAEAEVRRALRGLRKREPVYVGESGENIWIAGLGATTKLERMGINFEIKRFNEVLDAELAKRKERE